MSPTPNSGGGFVLCARCGQRLAAGTTHCLYCGAPQDAAVARPGMPEAVVPVFGAVEPAASVFGEAFAGTPASTGRRLIALTIDVVAVLIVVAVVLVATRSMLLAGVVLAELWVGFWIAQARTGLGLGKALLRLRVARAETPYSPGLGRAFVRAVITTGGALVFGVGAWIVEASSAWDASPKRRAWSDRAARTVVVAVPARTVGAPRPVTVAPPVVQQSQHRVAADPDAPGRRWTPPPPVQAPEPTPVPGLASAISCPRVAAPAPAVPAPAPAPAAPAPAAPAPAPTAAPARRAPAPAPTTPAPAAPAPAAPVGARLRRDGRAPAPIESVPVLHANPAPTAPVDSGAVLLILDTGERTRVAAGASVVLGRKPASDTDLVFAVVDPTVSKNHARLENRGADVWITDLGSTNGTELVDESGRAIAVPARAATRVEDGMRVRIGDRLFTVNRLMGAGS